MTVVPLGITANIINWVDKGEVLTGATIEQMKKFVEASKKILNGADNDKIFGNLIYILNQMPCKDETRQCVNSNPADNYDNDNDICKQLFSDVYNIPSSQINCDMKM